MVPKMWDKLLWEGVWPYLDPWDSVRLRTASNVPRQYGPHGELFLFLLKKEPTVLSELIELGPCISAETVKACALIGLHTMAEENALRSDSDSSPYVGDMWRYGCPKSPVWGSNAVELGGNEGTSSLQFYEHNVGNLALEVHGQNRSSEVISLSLEDWEVGGIKLPVFNGHFVPRNEGCVLEELRVAGFTTFTVFIVPGRKDQVF